MLYCYTAPRELQSFMGHLSPNPKQTPGQKITPTGTKRLRPACETGSSQHSRLVKGHLSQLSAKPVFSPHVVIFKLFRA